MKKTKILAPTHPGEVLLEEFLKPLGISQYRLAKSLLVPLRRVNEIVLRRRGISADMALRLGRFFGTTAEFWLNLQSGYEKEIALRDGASQTLQQFVPLKDTQRISAA